MFSRGFLEVMRKDDFLKLGLDEDLAVKCEQASLEELKSFIPKSRFDEVNNEKKRLESDLKDLGGKLEELNKSNGTIEELTKRLEELKLENKEKDRVREEELRGMRMDAAIDRALEDAGVMHLKAGRSLIDRESLSFDKQGNLIGLEAQIHKLTASEDTKFMFKSPESSFTGISPEANKGGLPERRTTYEGRLAEARAKGDNLGAIKIKQDAYKEGIVLN